MSFVQVHSDVIKLVFENLGKEFRDKKTVSTKTLNELDHIFRAPLQPAMRLVDRRRVKRLTCPRGRVVYQVSGETRAFYTCLPSSNFCACYSYLHQVLRRQEIPMCKHVLASRLAEALGTCEDVRCTDDTMAFSLQSLS
ncbi:zinc finger SWIM domain-containing protein 7-like [Dermacentor albipictus]|uniref:zinc finger SWIM domain-containing protein 7-like n=1 Tax=Dermacentor albipictus TaxID=60249 RepID=UPI0031FC1A4F